MLNKLAILLSLSLMFPAINSCSSVQTNTSETIVRLYVIQNSLGSSRLIRLQTAESMPVEMAEGWFCTPPDGLERMIRHLER